MTKHANVRSRNGERQMRRTLLAILVAGCFSSGTANANPAGAQVVNGQVSIVNQGNILTVTNSPGAIINWQRFSIDHGETTRFLQQNANSAVLNRITGQDPSQILGALQSNGRVFLINPNGILFGQGAQVDVNGLVASTLNIGNNDFLAGKLNFNAGDKAGTLRNQGTITTPGGGQIYLIAPSIENSGIIHAPGGNVLLAAGHSVQLLDSANPDLHVVVSAPDDQALNLGSIIAESGRIGIYGALIKQRGTVSADSAVVGANGKILLKASGTTLLEAGSRTSATGAGRGGDIQILGKQVGLTGDAMVDASGHTGGGTALIGGDYQGKNAAVQNASRVYLGKKTSVAVNAGESGDGGKLVVWSDQATRAYGTLSARGGALGGNGGQIETSGHYLDIAGIRVDASAVNGSTGSWLLDPYDIDVGITGGALLTDVDQFSDPPSTSTSYISASTVSAATADVSLQAMHDLTFSNAVNIGTANVSLRAEAGNDINVNSGISTQGGNVMLTANSGTFASGSGAVHINAGISTKGGAIDVGGMALTLSDALNGGPVRLRADRMALAGTINANGNPVMLAPVTSGTAIDLGTVATDTTPNTLELSNQELANIQAGHVVIGDTASSGAIRIKSTLTTGFPSLSLSSASTITQDPGALLGGAQSLRLEGSAVMLPEGNPTGVIAGRTTSGDFQYHSVNGISVEQVDGLSGITVPASADIKLSSDMNIGQNSPLSGGGLLLLSSTGGGFNLMNPQNNVARISASYGGNLDYFNQGDLEVASIPYGAGTVNGITANGMVHLVTGPYAKLTVSQPIDGGSVGLTADRMALAGPVNANGNPVMLAPVTSGTAIDLGTVATDTTPNTLELSNQELANIQAGRVVIGDVANSGAIRIRSTLLTTSFPSLSLLSASTISQDPGALLAGGLSLRLEGSAVMLPEGNPTGVIAGKTTSGDFEYHSVNDISVQQIDGLNGITVPASADIKLLSDKNIGQQSPLSGGGLALGAADRIDLMNPQNNVARIGAVLNGTNLSAGGMNYFNQGDLEVASMPYRTGTLSGITTSGMATRLVTGQSAKLTVSQPIIGGPIQLKADRMALTGTINANGNPVMLTPSTSGTAIDLGTVATDTTPNTLELSNQELANIQAGRVVIGDAASSGAIRIRSTLTTGFPSLSLLSASTISQDPGALLAGGLSLRLEGSAVKLLEGNPTGVIAGKTTSGDFQYHSVNGISVQQVDGLNGITVPASADIKLLSDKNIGQQSPLSGGGLALGAADRIDLMNPQNNVARIGAVLTGTGTGELNYFNQGDLEVASIPYGTGTLSGITANGMTARLVTGTHAKLTISQPITSAEVDLETDHLALNSTVTANDASISPHSSGRPVTVGSTSCHDIDVSDGSCLSITQLYRVAAGTIGIGHGGDGVAVNPGDSQTGPIYVEGITAGVSKATDRNGITTRIGLLSSASVSQGTGLGIDVQDLGAIAGGKGAVNLTNGNNKVANIAGKTAGGDFAFVDAADINVTTLSGGVAGSNSTAPQTTDTGTTTTATTVTAADIVKSSSSSPSYSLPGINVGSGNIGLRSAGAVRGAGLIGGDLHVKANTGIGLQTQVGSLTAVNEDNSGSSNIEVNNTGVLTLGDVVQSGSAGGNIVISNQGAVTVAALHAVHTGTGSINLAAHSPLTVNGAVTSNSGAITLGAVSSTAGNDTLTINGKVATSGSVTLKAGTAVVVNGIVNGATVTTDVDGDVSTTGSDCASDPLASGCDAIKTTTDTVVNTVSDALEPQNPSGPSADAAPLPPPRLAPPPADDKQAGEQDADNSVREEPNDRKPAGAQSAKEGSGDEKRDGKKDDKKAEKKDAAGPKDKGAKKDEHVKKMYCN